MTRLSCTMLTLATAVVACAQTPPVIEWQRNLGGALDDLSASIEQTSDGGYVLCGTTNSNDGDVAGNHGTNDIWVVKLDAQGNIQWQKCLGGSTYEFGSQVLPLPNGGYVILGATESNNGDVVGNHGMSDTWLAELDEAGDLIWQHCYGGSFDDWARSLHLTPDGGFIVSGTSGSSNGDVTTNAGDLDYWIMKLDASGSIQWQRSFGGSQSEDSFAVLPTTDGGFLVNGFTSSDDGDVSGAFGLVDEWVIKLNNAGVMVWQRPCGGSGIELPGTVIEIDGDIYCGICSSDSQDGDVSGPIGGQDIWAVRLTASGVLIDETSYGGSENDNAYDALVANENGMILCGSSASSDGDLTSNQGATDGWLFRVDSNGVILWSSILGGSNSDSFRGLNKTIDGGYIAIGTSTSADGDLPGNNGGRDVWVVKFGADPVGILEPTSPSEVYLSPNPCTDRLRFSTSYETASSHYWQIVDAEGKLVDSGNMQNATTELNTSALKPGAYNLVLHCAGDMVAAPFVKE